MAANYLGQPSFYAVLPHKTEFSDTISTLIKEVAPIHNLEKKRVLATTILNDSANDCFFLILAFDMYKAIADNKINNEERHK